MSDKRSNALMDSISQIMRVPSEVSAAMIHEISTVNIPYKRLYDDYHSSGWYIAALYTSNEGENDEALVRDGIAKPTQLAEIMPKTRQFLEGLGLEFLTVRIARMDAESFLWEHRDYAELNDRRKLRLHVPLITNPGAAMHFPGLKVHMTPGWLWKLDPVITHAASNTGTDSRIHLILDCYVNSTLSGLLDRGILEEQNCHPLPPLNTEERRKALQEAQGLLEHAGIEKAEQFLLKLFHRFDLHQESSYDILIDFYHAMGFEGRAKNWIQQQITRIYSREKLDPNTIAMKKARKTLISTLHPHLGNLPQVRILEKILSSFEHYSGLEKVYVRGSLARGTADAHSDIDLFCEVPAHEFVSFNTWADAEIQRHHNAIADGLVDTVVKDFGGIGHIYMIEDGGKLYQLDLYVSCIGRPWGIGTYRREIFSRLDSDIDAPKRQALLYRLHEATVQEEIRRLQAVEPSVALTLLELNVMGFMLKKCLERGDLFVSTSEYNTWRHCFVKMIRHKIDVQYLDYGFYHIQRLAVEAGDGGRLFEDLHTIFTSPLTLDNFKQVHHYAMNLAQELFPEESARQKRLITAMASHVGIPELGNKVLKLSPWGKNTA